MKVLLVGLSHHTAPVDVRERFARDAEEGDRMLRTLLTYTGQGVVVATCNRTEIYTTVTNTEIGVQHLRRFLSDYSQTPPGVLDEFLFTAAHEDAARHLFQVASGIDSMIVGEEQVLGQVRDAMEAAQALDGLNPILYTLLRHGLRVGKAARTHTAISRRAVSVSSAAVGLARERFGDLRNATVLVVSAGEAGELTARALADHGAGRILVTSRTFESAARLANALGGQPLPFSDLEWALGEADIVVSSTAAPTYVLTHDLIRRVMDRRGERKLRRHSGCGSAQH
ncbi:MAG: glutamyl-tRNA reductase [Chloroflexi bacterium]|nr:glutamyl-tRNA reductase [Chloroflexota bacterium]